MNLTPRYFWELEWGYHINMELFCCFWRCNRNSGHRFLYTCLPKILGRLCSLSTLSVTCWWSQWGVMAARQSDSWWRWWSDIHCEWCSQCYDQTHFYHVHFGFARTDVTGDLHSVFVEFSLQSHRYWVSLWPWKYKCHEDHSRHLLLLILY